MISEMVQKLMKFPLQDFAHFQRLAHAGLTSSQPGGSEKSQSTLVLPHRPLDLNLILCLQHAAQ